MNRYFWAVLAALFLPVSALAQGVLINVIEPVPLPRPIIIPPRPPHPPRPPQLPPSTYSVDSIVIEAKIRDQLADVQVSQTFLNTGKATLEAQFVFPLPYDGAIDSMTLLVDGKELPAKLLSAEEARKRYNEIVRKNRDPALLEWMGSGMFQTSVFPIPAGEKRAVTLHYNQLLRKQDALTDFLFPLSTARYSSKPVSNLSLKLSLETKEDLKSIYSPNYPIQINRTGARQALIEYKTTNSLPQEDFRLVFDTGNSKVGATLMTYRHDTTDEGYFLLLASPEWANETKESPPKTISFVLDKSGSMSGAKMTQAQEGARFVLNNLRDTDLFNIISYDSTIAAFRPELESAKKEGRESATAYINSLYAGGGTNIHDALIRSLADLKDPQRPNFILFLTDGVPTAGETNESRIAKAAREANKLKARLLCFGVGYDVNSRLLDRLARENHGLSEYIRPDENIETAISRIYQRISSPVMTNIELTFEEEGSSGTPISRMYPGGELDLFRGEQLVVVGRYKGKGPVQIRMSGNVNGEKQTHNFSGEFIEKSPDQSNAFIARLWATRRIGELIDELDLNGKNDELIQELVTLSTKYGILTPYTAFLADETVKPELTDTMNFRQASENLQALDASSGASGFYQRAAKQSLKSSNQAPAASSSLEMLSSEPAYGGLPVELRTRSTKESERPSVIQKGATTLYRRGTLLMTPETASLDPEKDKEKIQKIERFSDEYFQLIKDNSPAENQLLSEQNADERLLVQFRGKNYLIE